MRPLILNLALVLFLASVSALPLPQSGSSDIGSYRRTGNGDIDRVLEDALRRRQDPRVEERRRMQEERRRQQEEFEEQQRRSEERRAEEDARQARNRTYVNTWSVILWFVWVVVGLVVGGVCCWKITCACLASAAEKDKEGEAGAAGEGNAREMEVLKNERQDGAPENGHVAGGFIFSPDPTAATTVFTPPGGQQCTFTPIEVAQPLLPTNGVLEVGRDSPYNPSVTPEPGFVEPKGEGKKKNKRIPGPTE